MESLASLYKNHIATLQERTRDALARFKLDALLIHSGELFNVFLDDHPYPFKVNPQFKERWRASSWMRYLFTPANCSTFFSTIIPIRLK